jgi:hypothetical protein
MCQLILGKLPSISLHENLLSSFLLHVDIAKLIHALLQILAVNMPKN